MMTLTYCPDTTAASSLVRSGTPATQLMNFGPASFEAFGRLRFIPDPVAPGQDEADADTPAGHPSDITQARRALRLLASFTSTRRTATSACGRAIRTSRCHRTCRTARSSRSHTAGTRCYAARCTTSTPGKPTSVVVSRSLRRPSSGLPTAAGFRQRRRTALGRDRRRAGRHRHAHRRPTARRRPGPSGRGTTSVPLSRMQLDSRCRARGVTRTARRGMLRRGAASGVSNGDSPQIRAQRVPAHRRRAAPMPDVRPAQTVTGSTPDGVRVAQRPAGTPSSGSANE